MKELKRISAFFMAMLMMLTVFSAFSVVSAEGEAAGGTQPVWPAQGSIKLDKDAAAVVGCRRGESLGNYPRHSGQKLRNNI